MEKYLLIDVLGLAEWEKVETGEGKILVPRFGK